MAKTTKKVTRRGKKAPESTGLTPAETRAKAPVEVERLCGGIEEDGGAVLTSYRDPLGGHWLLLAVLPLAQLEPTPFQRGLSEAHVKRLADAISKTDRYLDPVIAVRVGPKRYQTPNGHHRASALKLIGARSITALVVTEPEVARLILALNIEKAHNLREKSLEVMRLARDLAAIPSLREVDCALEFEEPAYLTLGLCYDQNGRFAGGAYHPLLKRVDEFLEKPIQKALAEREGYVKKLLEIEAKAGEIVQALKAKGLESPYLKSFVVARLNPLRFRRDATLPIDEALEKMLQAAQRFNTEKINAGDLARTGGMADEPAS